MPFPVLPVALGGGVLALLLLSRRQVPLRNTTQVIPNRGGGGGGGGSRGNRPFPRPLPPGTIGVARVVPNREGGMIIRTSAGVSVPRERTFIAPEGDLRHAYNGDEVAVFERGIRPPNAQGPEEWWRLQSPGGGSGYARAVDPQGVANFSGFEEAGGGGGGGGGEAPIVTRGWGPYDAIGIDPMIGYDDMGHWGRGWGRGYGPVPYGLGYGCGYPYGPGFGPCYGWGGLSIAGMPPDAMGQVLPPLRQQTLNPSAKSLRPRVRIQSPVANVYATPNGRGIGAFARGTMVTLLGGNLTQRAHEAALNGGFYKVEGVDVGGRLLQGFIEGETFAQWVIR